MCSRIEFKAVLGGYLQASNRTGETVLRLNSSRGTSGSTFEVYYPGTPYDPTRISFFCRGYDLGCLTQKPLARFLIATDGNNIFLKEWSEPMCHNKMPANTTFALELWCHSTPSNPAYRLRFGNKYLELSSDGQLRLASSGSSDEDYRKVPYSLFSWTNKGLQTEGCAYLGDC